VLAPFFFTQLQKQEVLRLMTLSEKQQKFIAEYLVDLNATQAAIRAGYTSNRADQTGYENLRKPEIQSAIREAINQRAKRTQLDQDWVISKLQENVERSMALVPVLGPDGSPCGVYAYDGRTANKALELLGKHLAMFTEKHLVETKPPTAPLVGFYQVELPHNGRDL